MKKTYQAPVLYTELVEVEGLIALSLQGGKADSSDALVKDDDWGDIWDGGSDADLGEE